MGRSRRAGRAAAVGLLPRAPLLLLPALAGACVGPGLLREEPLEAGESMVFPEALEAVLPVALAAMREAELALDQRLQVNDSTWMLLGSRILSEREVAAAVRVVVQGRGEEETAVYVLSRRRLPTQIAIGGGDPYADEIFSHMVATFLERSRRKPPPGSGGGEEWTRGGRPMRGRR